MLAVLWASVLFILVLILFFRLNKITPHSHLNILGPPHKISLGKQDDWTECFWTCLDFGTLLKTSCFLGSPLPPTKLNPLYFHKVSQAHSLSSGTGEFPSYKAGFKGQLHS